MKPYTATEMTTKASDSKVFRSLENADKNASILLELVARAEDALSAATGPGRPSAIPNPVAGIGGAHPMPANSQLVDRIDSLGKSLQASINRLTELLDRVEL